MRNYRGELEQLKRAAASLPGATTVGAYQPPDVLAGTFPEARAFIEDPAELKWCLATRRAAKSYSVCLDFINDSFTHPYANYLALFLTRDSAKRVWWKDCLKEIDRTFALSMKFNESELTATMPNGAVIYLLGLDADDKQRRKVLGGKYRRAAIDEAQDWSTDLRDLVYYKLRPAIADQRGSIIVSGTPGNHTKSFWADLTRGCKAGTLGPAHLREPGWSPHTWRWEANPYTREQVAEQIARMKVDNPLIVETAGFRQNYDGEWCLETEAQVYRFNPARNTFTTLPVYDGCEWTYVLAIDLGYSPDPTAFTLMAFHPFDPVLYILESWKKTGLDVTDVANQIKGNAALRIIGYEQRFRLERRIIDNANAQAVAELSRRHGLLLEPAEKVGKSDYQQLMSDDLIQGRIKAHPEKCAALIDEWQSLIWDPDSMRRQEHPRLPNHCADAALYGWRATYSFLAKVPVVKPQPGTPEYGKAQQRDMFEAMQREMRSIRTGNHPDDDWGTDAGLGYGDGLDIG